MYTKTGVLSGSFLLDEVEKLVSNGELGGPQTTPLVLLLGQVQDSMNRGNGAAASGQLESFVRQVEALVRSRRLSPGDGQRLIDLAGELASQL